ncbi:hypothetical protein FQN57_003501 [Myotisia sp. PD_48]|nr:hypothetical protein FQN57_003501 [Myotisia sp. PD_48]
MAERKSMSDSIDSSHGNDRERMLIDEDEKFTPPPPKPQNAIVLLAVTGNTLSTCLLVLLNKYIFSYPNLQSVQISFTGWHVFCTFLILFVVSRRPFSLFEPVKLDIWEVLPLSVAFTAWVILNNYSLALNPVGFYQITKITVIPTVVALEYFSKGATVTRTIGITLVGICIGAALTCRGSMDTNPLGVFVAAASVGATAVYQVWISKKQVGVNSAQLLYNQSYVSLGLLAIAAPLIEYRSLIKLINNEGGQLDARAFIATPLSGAVAMVVNLTQFMVIGKTSAVTFNVAGHSKTAIILIAGWITQPQSFNWVGLMGVFVAFASAVAYSLASNKRRVEQKV